MLNAIKQRESKLINDVNRMEKKLTNEMNYSKDLLNKLSKVQEHLQFAQKKHIEAQKSLEITKNTSELTNTELQQQLKVLQKEKEEIIKRENVKIKVKHTCLYKSLCSNLFDKLLNTFRIWKFCMKICKPSMLKKCQP